MTMVPRASNFPLRSWFRPPADAGNRQLSQIGPILFSHPQNSWELLDIHPAASFAQACRPLNEPKMKKTERI
jgi:hypothetical protein